MQTASVNGDCEGGSSNDASDIISKGLVDL